MTCSEAEHTFQQQAESHRFNPQPKDFKWKMQPEFNPELG